MNGKYKHKEYHYPILMNTPFFLLVDVDIMF